jgi:serralysin
MKIYISSTFEDLKDYRAKVYNQLRKLRQDVISMEDYVAGDQRPLAKCLEDITDCDIYVGIIAWRYGFVPTKENPSKLSITELEYRQAAKLKKQCLLFILDKNIAWQPQFMDSQSGVKPGGKNINDFRNRLGERHMIGWFTTADQLASDVVAAVYKVQFEARVLTAPNTSAEKIPEKKELPKKVAPSKKVSPQKMADKQAGYPKLWEPGSLLRVNFLDGNSRQKSLVKRFASIWSAYANINFQFDEDMPGEVRVSFNEKDGGSWSYVGTDALVVASNLQTVNFGWLNDKIQDTDAETVILKQFGHVLGLMNEHQNPTAKIPWNKEAVYKTYQDPPNYWTRKDVDHMMFATWDKNVYPVQKRFDPESIMFYRLPPEFTNGKIITPAEEGLSQGDKAFVARLYPFDYSKRNKEK